MKAPDKIYMPNELLSEEWQRHIKGEDTCYIRKDALIDKLYKWMEEDTTVADYYSKKQFKKVIDNLF